jgi:hypothetical protein
MNSRPPGFNNPTRCGLDRNPAPAQVGGELIAGSVAKSAILNDVIV